MSIFSDIDSHYDTDSVSKEVEKEMDTKLKSATKTTSFYVLIATVLAGVIVTTLISMGWIPAEMKESSVATFSAVIAGAIAWVAGKYIEGRSAVSLIKAQAQAARELSAEGISSPFGHSVDKITPSSYVEEQPAKRTRRRKG